MQKLFDSLGHVCAVIGAQWGDEGKGKIIDLLTPHFDVLARACGGANAGHTIVVNGKKHVFHLLPAGSLHPEKPIVLGSGMVIHLPTLLQEMHTLETAGIPVRERLFLSPAAHLVCEYHKAIDAVLEERRTKSSGQGIGTTKRGIGPAYSEKAARSGLRMEALGLSDAELRRELEARAKEVQNAFDVSLDLALELRNFQEAREHLHDRILPNLPHFLHECLRTSKRILVEGAQGTLLDIDHGTYPFVTSSSTTAAGALQGLALPPRALTSCIGVAKAYCTRVGSGTFPTEVMGEQGDRLRERGGEYGATTGRPRRCGWLSVPDLMTAAMINGFTHWNITKLDVLDAEEEIPVGVSNDVKEVRYERLPGWKSSTQGGTDWDRLPPQAQDFIAFIEKHTDVPVAFLGTGPQREDMIVRDA